LLVLNILVPEPGKTVVSGDAVLVVDMSGDSVTVVWTPDYVR
jgi:hypothetical protein